MKWAYGVTTVPGRKDNLLRRTLESLCNGGFDNPRLFVDGDSDPLEWQCEFGLEVTVRNPKVRTFANWMLGMAELYLRNPDAERFAMFQDDFITYRNLRQYLELCDYPDEVGPPLPGEKVGGRAAPRKSSDKGYWNLYTFQSNQGLAPRGKTGFYTSNQLGRGAVALVFSKRAVLALLSNSYTVQRALDTNRGWKAVDGGIVCALKTQGWREYVHNPSLVQHVGKVSTMGNLPHQQAPSWRGEHFDALELFNEPRT